VLINRDLGRKYKNYSADVRKTEFGKWEVISDRVGFDGV